MLQAFDGIGRRFAPLVPLPGLFLCSNLERRADTV